MKSVLSIILVICPFLLFASDWPGTEVPNEVANNKLDMSPLLFIIVFIHWYFNQTVFKKVTHSIYCFIINNWFSIRSY